ncbi:hypothetical protein [Tsukamurella pseudospumae]|uniref:Uncharacterized protein n=1 Tax=Tsukamurella pseudospumae TaxID=239498 RepID=A0A138AUV0_9ACTN|nr:hypothetical protein [Tsukamurella pseudospumae]KXP14202.1 hypothetical protein AXK60_21180 [Tsukamurella pseudospumae]
MTGPGPHGGYHPQEPGQAYSQALPLPAPPRGPAAPGPVPGGPPPQPPRKPSSGRNLIVGIVAVAAVVALIAAIVTAALLNDSKGGNDPGKGATSATIDATGQVFRINDCLYDVPENPKVGNCDDGGSPYKVTQVMPVGEACKKEQTSIAKGRAYCLTPNLNVNYCYSAPVPGTWIKAAAQCGAPGTITVISVVGGLKDSARCTGEWDRSYFFDDPVYTICAKSYT